MMRERQGRRKLIHLIQHNRDNKSEVMNRGRKTMETECMQSDNKSNSTGHGGEHLHT